MKYLFPFFFITFTSLAQSHQPTENRRFSKTLKSDSVAKESAVRSNLKEKSLLSIKKLYEEPLFYLRNDTLFTVDIYDNMVLCKDYSKVYRLKVLTGNNNAEREYQYEHFRVKEVPWFDFSPVEKKLDSLPNLQYLDLYFLQLWEFPKKVTSIESLQILVMDQIAVDDRTEHIYHNDPIPQNLWKMKNLKYLSLYLEYDERHKPYVVFLDDRDKKVDTRQYVPDNVKFDVGKYIRVDDQIKRGWFKKRTEERRKHKLYHIDDNVFKNLRKIFSQDYLNECECE